MLSLSLSCLHPEICDSDLELQSEVEQTLQEKQQMWAWPVALTELVLTCFIALLSIFLYTLFFLTDQCLETG